jgi:hypothetical protein
MEQLMTDSDDTGAPDARPWVADDPPEAVPPSRVENDRVVVEAFAGAIVRPRGKALLILPDNRGGGWVPIREAVSTGSAFAVEVDGDILAFDADEPNHVPIIEAAARRLRSAGCIPVTVASGRVGHLHLFARVPDSVLRAAVAAEARASGLPPRKTIRPPLSPHRQGLPVALVEPADVPQALRALRPTLRARDLSPRIRALLRNGDRERRYATQSEVVQAIVQGCAHAEWPEGRIFAALTSPHNVGGEKVQEKLAQGDERAARRYVEHSVRKARDLRQHGTSPALRRAMLDAIDQIAKEIERHAWPGMAGATDYTVLAAHLAIAHAACSTTYTASVRQIAEGAEVTPATAHRAHGRLIRGGWLQVVTIGYGRFATAWRLGTPVDQPRDALDNTTPALRGGCED